MAVVVRKAGEEAGGGWGGVRWWCWAAVSGEGVICVCRVQRKKSLEVFVSYSAFCV